MYLKIEGFNLYNIFIFINLPFFFKGFTGNFINPRFFQEYLFLFLILNKKKSTICLPKTFDTKKTCDFSPFHVVFNFINLTFLDARQASNLTIFLMIEFDNSNPVQPPCKFV